MGWLKDILYGSSGSSQVKVEEQAKKRRSKEHSKKVRQREKELRGGSNSKFFWDLLPLMEHREWLAKSCIVHSRDVSVPASRAAGLGGKGLPSI